MADGKAIGALRVELEVLEALMRRNKNQHRRAKYYKFLQGVLRGEKEADVLSLLQQGTQLLQNRPPVNKSKQVQRWGTKVLSLGAQLRTASERGENALGLLMKASTHLSNQVHKAFFLALSVLLLSILARIMRCTLHLMHRLDELSNTLGNSLASIPSACVVLDPEKLRGLSKPRQQSQLFQRLSALAGYGGEERDHGCSASSAPGDSAAALLAHGSSRDAEGVFIGRVQHALSAEAEAEAELTGKGQSGAIEAKSKGKGKGKGKGKNVVAKAAVLASAYSSSEDDAEEGSNEKEKADHDDDDEGVATLAWGLEMPGQGQGQKQVKEAGISSSSELELASGIAKVDAGTKATATATAAGNESSDGIQNKDMSTKSSPSSGSTRASGASKQHEVEANKLKVEGSNFVMLLQSGSKKCTSNAATGTSWSKRGKRAKRKKGEVPVAGAKPGGAGNKKQRKGKKRESSDIMNDIFG